MSQIWNTWKIKISHFITIFNFRWKHFLLEAKYLLYEILMFWNNRQEDLINTKLMPQFFRNRLKLKKIVEHSLILVQNYIQNLNKILVSKFGNH